MSMAIGGAAFLQKIFEGQYRRSGARTYNPEGLVSLVDCIRLRNRIDIVLEAKSYRNGSRGNGRSIKLIVKKS